MQSNNVLLTGFGPFLSYDYNPSAEIARILDGETLSGKKIIGKVLPVKHNQIREVINNYIREWKPVAIISLGLKAGIGCIGLERVALNRYYFRDEKEEIDESLYKTGENVYFSTLPLKEIKITLQNIGIPAEFSFSADTYISNELFYEVMKTSERLKIESAGLIHLPLSNTQVASMNKPHYALREKIPSMDENMMKEAVKIVIENTLGKRIK